MSAVSRIVSISSMTSPWRNTPLARAGLRPIAPTTRNLPPDCLTCRPMPTLPMCSSALRPSTHCRTRSGDATAKSTASGKPFSPSIRTWNMQCFAPPIPEPFRTSGLVADLRGCKFSEGFFYVCRQRQQCSHEIIERVRRAHSCRYVSHRPTTGPRYEAFSDGNERLVDRVLPLSLQQSITGEFVGISTNETH